MRLPVFALLAALLLVIPLAADTVVEEIVARVNSDIITRSEFQRSRDQLLNELKQKFGSEADAKFAENEKNVLRDLIDQDLLVQPEQVRMSEIMISTQPKEGEKEKKEPTLEELAAAEQKAHGLLDSIHKGTSFEEVAKKSSEGPTAAQGGDLGYFKRGMLAKELEDLTFGMKPGDVSDVIRNRQGFVILKVTEHTVAGIPPMKELEPQIQDAIYVQKLQPALRA